MTSNLSNNIIDVSPEVNLDDFLSQPRRIKLGFDPTSDYLHLGHSILLRKLGAFQRNGHTPVVIIGDFTARVGDPTGKNSTRPQLDAETVAANSQSFLGSLGNFLDLAKCEVVFNSKHLAALGLGDLVKLQSLMTVQQLLAKRDFADRFNDGTPISLHEFMYPLLQGYDSFAIDSDVELGGIDQKFNVSVGRLVQKGFGSNQQQIGMLMPILVGTDGSEKMSKSLGNAIGITEHPFLMYSKLEKIPDNAVNEFITLLTDCDLGQFSENPREKQKQMAVEVTAVFHGIDKALDAQRDAETVVLNSHSNSQPEGVPVVSLSEITLPTLLVKLLKDTELAKSTSEARRMVRSGSVFLSGLKVTDEDITVKLKDVKGKIIRLSKRQIYKFIE